MGERIFFDFGQGYSGSMSGIRQIDDKIMLQNASFIAAMDAEKVLSSTERFEGETHTKLSSDCSGATSEINKSGPEVHTRPIVTECQKVESSCVKREKYILRADRMITDSDCVRLLEKQWDLYSKQRHILKILVRREAGKSCVKGRNYAKEVNQFKDIKERKNLSCAEHAQKLIMTTDTSLDRTPKISKVSADIKINGLHSLPARTNSKMSKDSRIVGPQSVFPPSKSELSTGISARNMKSMTSPSHERPERGKPREAYLNSVCGEFDWSDLQSVGVASLSDSIRNVPCEVNTLSLVDKTYLLRHQSRDLSVQNDALERVDIQPKRTSASDRYSVNDIKYSKRIIISTLHEECTRNIEKLRLKHVDSSAKMSLQIEGHLFISSFLEGLADDLTHEILSAISKEIYSSCDLMSDTLQLDEILSEEN